MKEIARIYVDYQLNELGMYFFGFLIYFIYCSISASVYLISLSFAASFLGLRTRQLHIGRIALIKVREKWVLSLKNQPFRIAGSVRFEKSELGLSLWKKLFFGFIGVSSSIILITLLILRPFLLPIVNSNHNFITMLRFLNMFLPIMEIVFLTYNLMPKKFGFNYFTLGYIVFHKS